MVVEIAFVEETFSNLRGNAIHTTKKTAIIFELLAITYIQLIWTGQLNGWIAACSTLGFRPATHSWLLAQLQSYK